MINFAFSVSPCGIISCRSWPAWLGVVWLVLNNVAVVAVSLEFKLTRHIKLSYFASTALSYSPLSMFTLLCWALYECVVKRFIIFAIFMDFPTISPPFCRASCVREPFRAVHVASKRRGSETSLARRLWRREREKNVSSKNNKKLQWVSLSHFYVQAQLEISIAA